MIQRSCSSSNVRLGNKGSDAASLLGGAWIAALILLAIAMSAASAQALTNYADQNGTSFSFTNMDETTNTAGDAEPLWGTPTVLGDTLLFTPAGFISTANGGAVDQTASTFRLTITSLNKASTAIDQLMVNEYGDYALTGAGTAATTASVLAGAFLAVTEVNLNGVLTVSNIIGNASDSADFDTPVQSGVWSLGLTADIQALVDTVYGGDAFATSVSIVWNNDLATTSEENSTALIQKKIGVPSVTMQVVPEPGTALLLGLGLVAMGASRRR